MEDSDRLSALRHALRERLGNERFELWLGDDESFSLEDGVLRVRCASLSVLKLVRRRMDDSLGAICSELWSTPPTISYEVFSLEGTGENEGAAPAKPPLRGKASLPRRATSHRPVTNQRSLFDDDSESGKAANDKRGSAKREAVEPSKRSASPQRGATPSRSAFEDFTIGPSNALAAQAAQEAADQPGRYTPLLLTGPSGCGKTHLFEAIVERVRRLGLRRRVLRLTSEQFTTQFVEALHRRELPTFRQKSRMAELLLIDDVQFLLPKKATLGELVSTIDAVHGRGGQVVLAADRPASDFRQFSPELAARIAAGLTATIDPAECSVRRGIVVSHARRMGVSLSAAIVELVAQQVVGSGRLLAGAINRLAAAAVAAGRTLTDENGEAVDFAAGELADFCRQHSPQVRLVDIQRAVCEVFGVEPARLKSAAKQRSIAEPRMLAMWLARRYTRSALNEIGEFFGRRSHSTVVSAQKKLDGLIGGGGAIRLGDQSCHIEEALRLVEARLRSA